jgi:ferrous-iron efflux pump FieF
MADPLLGLAIAGWLLLSTREVLVEALDQLLDRELPDAERDRICELAWGTRGVLGVHALRTRRSGRTRLIEMHLELDAQLTIAESETIAEAVRSAILEAFPGADILVQKDPADTSAMRD